MAASASAEPLSPEDLARKDEGGYVTGVPLVAYGTDIGFGGGGRAYYFWNGHRSDKRFTITPYLHRVFLQVFASTRGLQYHWLDYDAPRVAGSPYRIRSQLAFARNINSNYYGHGNAALAPLEFPGATGTFDDMAKYLTAQQQVAGGMTYAKYDQFDLIKPIFIGSIERNVLRDRVRLLAGVGASYTVIDDYTGEVVDAEGGRAIQAPTRLREDCDAGKLLGCGGGRESWLRLGVSYDTRDFEPDPNRGIFADAALDAASVALGSEYDYLRLLVAFRGYWSPFPSHVDLVLAARGFVQFQTAGTPFFSLDYLPFTDDFRIGLGGQRTMRGFRQDRFVGRTMAAATVEARWTFTRFKIRKQKLALIAVPFLDTGRSFDHAGELAPTDFRTSYGAALRISWNLATIVTIDYGVSAEDAGFYINFAHMF
jgi:hypothetical protein